MTKIDALRRFLLPCFSPSISTPAAAAAPPSATKKRLSTSLRDDLPDVQEPPNKESSSSPSSAESTVLPSSAPPAPPRPSKTMVIGTLFGTRRGHAWLCVQTDRLSTKPLLLLELSVPTHQLVKEMQSGLARVALESHRPEWASCPLRSVPVWTMYCNGKRLGFASRRKANERNRLILKMMQSTTIGAGVIPAGFGSTGSEEIMYMRANYEHVVGSADTESFHLINPDECSSQEFSIFLMRS